MKISLKLSFHGGVQQVTGSNFLLDLDGFKVLVDCGLFQGSKYAETLNYNPFSYDPKSINAVLLTHSHADHSGRLPKLYKDGFRGKIFATRPTIDLSEIALEDNLDLIKDEARKDGHEPLFRSGDLHQALLLAKGIEYGETIDLGQGVNAIFHDAGHILGSAIVEIQWNDSQRNLRRIYFSGDLGNSPSPLLKNYKFPKEADYIVTESTYGDRNHDGGPERKAMLKQSIEETVKAGGTVIIPTFAIERTQELLYELNELMLHEHLPKIPIFLDSPLAIKLTKVYKKYEPYFNKKVLHEINAGESIFNFPGLKLTFSSNESRGINDVRGPKVIIAGSGMSLGGRILFHEQRYLPDPNSTILFVGYQVEGSPGRQILDGKKEIKLLGQTLPVRCKVKLVEGYSAHADQKMLLDWISKAKDGGNLKKVFVTHGEYHSSSVFSQKLKEELEVDSIVPEMGEEFELE